MTLVRTAVLLALVVASLAQAGCCCCFGSDWAQFTPPVREDDLAVEEARRYFQEQADALVAQLAHDAGPGNEGCVSGLGALAFDVAAAVITRGHAGGDSAAQVSIDPVGCLSRIVVLVVLTGGAWRAVSIVADSLAGGTASIGADPGYLLQETVSPPGESSSDGNWGSDELF